MSIERTWGSASYIDVVDRILDKGIVMDARMRVSLGGIDLITIDAHVIVASIDIYLRHWPEWDGAAAIAERSLILGPG